MEEETKPQQHKKIHGFVRHASKIKGLLENIKFFFKNPSYPRTITIAGIFLITVAIVPTVAILGKQTHLFQFAYIPGGGSCTSTAGKQAGSKYCCGNNVCQLYYTNDTCGTIIKTVQRCSACTAGPTCKPLPTPTPTPRAPTPTPPPCIRNKGQCLSYASGSTPPACPAGMKTAGLTDASIAACYPGSDNRNYECCLPIVAPTPPPCIAAGNSCVSYSPDSSSTPSCPANSFLDPLKRGCYPGTDNRNYICCQSGTAKYTCNSPTSFTGTDGSTTSCPVGQLCTGSSNTTDAKGPQDAVALMCSDTCNAAGGKGGAECAPLGACKANDGVVISGGTKLCPGSYVCCKQAPPTPTPYPNCEDRKVGGVCVPADTLDPAHPPATVCIGKIVDAANCTGNTFCCTGGVAKPTPVPMPKGDLCVGLDSSGKVIQKGICFYETNSGGFSTSVNGSCNINTGCTYDKIPATCTQMLTSANGGVNTPGHGISEIGGAQFNCQANAFLVSREYTCCAENSPPAPMLGPIDQVILKDGRNHLCGTGPGGSKPGVCIYKKTATLETKDPYSFSTLSKYANFGTIDSCNNLQSNWKDIPSDSSDCLAFGGVGLGKPYRCCAPDSSATLQNACTSSGGVCTQDKNHPYRAGDASLNAACSTGYCWVAKCPSNTSCTSGTTSPTPTGTGKGKGDGTGTGGPACTNGHTTAFTLTVKVPGIGKGKYENNSPKHGTRGVKLEVVDLNHGKAVKIKPRDGTYTLSNDGSISFTGVNLGSVLTCGGKYKVRIKVPGSLNVLSDQEIQYGADANTNKLTATLLPGDIVDTANHKIGSDNHITIEDYNLLAACRNNTQITDNAFGSTITVDCTSVANLLDYTDGGMTGDEWAANYNTIIRSWIQSGGNGQ